jgi:hypothetical protein
MATRCISECVGAVLNAVGATATRRQYARFVEGGRPVSGDVGCAASRAELHAEKEASASNKETGHGYSLIRQYLPQTAALPRQS